VVFDRAAEIENALADAVANRREGASAVDAVGGVAHALIERASKIPLDLSRGGMPSLAAASSTLGRAALDRTRRQADRLADVLAAEGEAEAEAAIVAWALVGVLQLLIEDLGRAQLSGEDPRLSGRRLQGLLDRRLDRLRPLSR
jgi:hypothetical protein